MVTDAMRWRAIREANAAVSLVARNTTSPRALSAMWSWEHDKSLERQRTGAS